MSRNYSQSEMAQNKRWDKWVIFFCGAIVFLAGNLIGYDNGYEKGREEVIATWEEALSQNPMRGVIANPQVGLINTCDHPASLAESSCFKWIDRQEISIIAEKKKCEAEGGEFEGVISTKNKFYTLTCSTPAKELWNMKVK